MPLPVLPPTTAWEEQRDKADALKKKLAEVSKAMETMGKDDAPALVDQLKKIAAAADAAGPTLKKLFTMDPQAARSLREQFQSVIDKAAEMAGKVRDKSADAGAAANKDTSRRTAQAAKAVAGSGQIASGAIQGAEVGGAIGELAGPEMVPVGAAIGAAMGAATAAIKQATEAFGDFVESSVQASNPGLWERYQRSIEDLGAVFGTAFAPIIEWATERTDELNGVLSGIAPVVADIVASVVGSFKPAFESLLPIFEQLAEGVKGIWADFGPQFKTIMEVVAASIIAAVKAAQLLINTLAALGRQLASGQGLDIGKAFGDAQAVQTVLDAKGKGAKDDKTFAARPAEFDSIEGIGQKTWQAAASAGASSGGMESDIANIATTVSTFASALQTAAVALMTTYVIPIATNVQNLADHFLHPLEATAKDAMDKAKASLGGGKLSNSEFFHALVGF
jgi:hypothetical protein